MSQIPKSERFWGEWESDDLKENQSNTKELLIESDIERVLENYERRLEDIEQIRIGLLKDYQFLYDEYLQFDEMDSLADDMVSCKIKQENIVQITINELLPFYNRIMKRKHYRELRDYYIPKISYAIRSVNPNVRFEKAVVMIVQYFPDSSIKDLDNQFKGFIFNALRGSQIIVDDSWRNLSYFVTGGKSTKEPRTEVYVSDYKNLQNMLKYSPDYM